MKCSADFLIANLPDAPTLPILQYSGLIPVDDLNDSRLFFWLVMSQDTPTDNLVVWLNGGPGCSSMDGMFLEIGPYRMTKQGALVENENSWYTSANILFLDQPAGTGFSYSSNDDGYVSSMDTLSREFAIFMERFFQVFTELSQDKVYLSGESYAGTYIPYIARELIAKNEVNLGGILIGNPWMDPYHQYTSIPEYAKQYGLINSGEYIELSGSAKKCGDLIQSSTSDNTRAAISSCDSLYDTLKRTSLGDGSECLNVYDIRYTEKNCGRGWPKELTSLSKYLRRTDVMSATHVDEKTVWTECASKVYSKLSQNVDAPAYHLVPELLQKVPIMFFNGQYDLLCNYKGVEASLNAIEWDGTIGFTQDRITLSSGGGYFKHRSGLTFVVVYNASHMVPYDQPAISRQLLDMFLSNSIEASNHQPSMEHSDSNYWWLLVIPIVLIAIAFLAMRSKRWRNQQWRKVQDTG